MCGDGLAENCVADESCVDKDKDHDPATTDCDDNDPTRHHATAFDPFPDPPNCCGYSLGKKGTADEGTNFLCPTGTCYAGKCSCDMLLCPKKRCGDGIDESCRGSGANLASNDTACVVDEDCDGYPSIASGGTDCDDHDPTVHPGAVEGCGGTKDLNCDGVIGGGCLPCDIDGDGYERNDSMNGCPDAKNMHAGVFDCNDYDAGVVPGQTSAPSNARAATAPESGTGLQGRHHQRRARQLQPGVRLDGVPGTVARGQDFVVRLADRRRRLRRYGLQRLPQPGLRRRR